MVKGRRRRNVLGGSTSAFGASRVSQRKGIAAAGMLRGLAARVSAAQCGGGGSGGGGGTWWKGSFVGRNRQSPGISCVCDRSALPQQPPCPCTSPNSPGGCLADCCGTQCKPRCVVSHRDGELMQCCLLHCAWGVPSHPIARPPLQVAECWSRRAQGLQAQLSSSSSGSWARCPRSGSNNGSSSGTASGRRRRQAAGSDRSGGTFRPCSQALRRSRQQPHRQQLARRRRMRKKTRRRRRMRM